MQKNIGSKLVENLYIKRCSDTDKVVPYRKNDTFYMPQNVLSSVPVPIVWSIITPIYAFRI